MTDGLVTSPLNQYIPSVLEQVKYFAKELAVSFTTVLEKYAKYLKKQRIYKD